MRVCAYVPVNFPPSYLQSRGAAATLSKLSRLGVCGARESGACFLENTASVNNATFLMRRTLISGNLFPCTFCVRSLYVYACAFIKSITDNAIACQVDEAGINYIRVAYMIYIYGLTINKMSV